MSYRTLFKKENEQIRERYDLAVERIGAIEHEHTVSAPWDDYFIKVAEFILMMDDLSLRLERDELIDADVMLLKDINQKLYQDIMPVNYGHSYANPQYAQSVLGQDYGSLLSVLYTEIRSMIVYAWECRRMEMTIYMELFLEVYNHFIWEQLPVPKQIRQSIYWFYSDYSDVMLTYRLRELVDVSLDFYTDIVMHSDLTDERYLYQYGVYISDAECQRAERMRAKSDIEIQMTALEIVDDYMEKVQMMWGDGVVKKTVNVQYAIGHERLVRAVIESLTSRGMVPVICRMPVQMILRKGENTGICCTGANLQYEQDHRFDEISFMDKALVERKLSVLKVACTQMKAQISSYAGAISLNAIDGTWVEDEDSGATYAFTEKQLKLLTDYAMQSAVILQKYTDVELIV